MTRRLAILARAGLAALLLAGAAGCATTGARTAGDKLDPWENWNRKVFAFNEGLDERVLKPVASAYKKVVPQFARDGVSNFFGNMADAWSAINNVLQGKFEPALRDTVRFTFNSVFGIFGLIDIVGDAGIDHQYEDFGQTLGRWGFGPGAYIVWPLLGPSSVRDSVALPLDRTLSTPAVLVDDGGAVVGLTLLQIVNTRAELLGASRVLDDIALDKYTFVRDAYLTRRRSLVYDGDPPEQPEAPGSREEDDGTQPAAAGAAPAAAAAASAAAASASAPSGAASTPSK